ncbi:hypothetical protein GCM10009738_84360 [Kitasatospora viridis]|uniref:Uncharacterized protein n=1 Tax=Kitasatospora viridis TaxID=281105 RepID=A0A561UC22_9ACTN|nr:hypothetical protein FHX73_11679 [Kitasatospora viridis]
MIALAFVYTLALLLAGVLLGVVTTLRLAWPGEEEAVNSPGPAGRSRTR